MAGMDDIAYAPETDVTVEDGELTEFPRLYPDGDFGPDFCPGEPSGLRLPVRAARDPDEEEDEEEDLDFFDDEEDDDEEFEDDDFDDEEFDEEEDDDEEEEPEDEDL